MKKYLICVLLFLQCMFFISAENVTITFDFSQFYINDNSFKENYGKKKYFPEGKIAFRISRNLYLWGSYGYFKSKYGWENWSNKGVIEADVEGKNVLDKTIISGGIGYYMGYLSRKEISLKFEIGLCRITHSIKVTEQFINTKETLFTDTRKEGGWGIRTNIGFTYGFTKNLFVEATFAYLYATDKIEGVRLKLGGFRIALGVGLTF